MNLLIFALFLQTKDDLVQQCCCYYHWSPFACSTLERKQAQYPSLSASRQEFCIHCGIAFLLSLSNLQRNVLSKIERNLKGHQSSFLCSFTALTHCHWILLILGNTCCHQSFYKQHNAVEQLRLTHYNITSAKTRNLHDFINYSL